MTELHTAPIRRLAQQHGTGRVEKAAVEEIKQLAEEYIKELVERGAVLTEHANRSTLKRDDILKAHDEL